MAKLSDNVIAVYARRAGFTGPDSAIAVAVALAESGGETTAVNYRDTGGTQSYGLWQINSVHESLLGSGDWRNPLDNARMAYAVFQRQGWRAWGTFTSGKYLLFMPRATVAAGSVEVGEESAGVADSLNPFDDIGRLLSFFADRNNWKRLGLIVAGSVLLILVIWSLVSRTGVVESASDAVKTVNEVVR